MREDCPAHPRVRVQRDYERIGRHHNAYATLKGDAQRVTARVGDQRAQGKFDDVAGPQSYWNFRDRPFVALLNDLRADGTATVEVKAVGETRTVRKACALVFEPDDQFGTTPAVTATASARR